MDTYEALVLESRADPDALLLLHDLLEERGEVLLLNVGEKYLVMTLTHYWVGEVTESTPGRTVLKDAAWIPDTGRLSVCLKEGTFNEVEPLPAGEYLVLNTQHVCSDIVWTHPLPRKVK